MRKTHFCAQLRTFFICVRYFGICKKNIESKVSKKMGSTSEEDCVIVDEVSSKQKIILVEDFEPVIKKIKEEESVPENQDFVLETVLGDGHCIAHCFASRFGESLAVVLERLQDEFTNNINLYSQFSELSTETLLEEVNEYVTKKRYNNTTVDLFLEAKIQIFLLRMC